jgi:L-ascorbate metabolism protein UlaG (beta-lactamase superfamily)
MKLTWFGHAAVRAENGSHVILIDPFLSGNPKSKGTVDEAAHGATHVVLTHGHDDHVGDAAEICKRTGATLVAVYELAMFLAGQGVDKIQPGNPGGGIDLGGGVRVSFVKAFHSSSTEADGKAVYLGNPCGVAVEGLGKTVYHMGDTDIFGDMALIEEFYAPKVGFVPIGTALPWARKRRRWPASVISNSRPSCPSITAPSQSSIRTRRNLLLKWRGGTSSSRKSASRSPSEAPCADWRTRSGG